MTSVRERQLSFVFADSPMGGGGVGAPDGSGGKAWLLQRAKPKTAKDLATGLPVVAS